MRTDPDAQPSPPVVLFGMSDELFPSGPWVGFYNHHPGDRHRMDMHLTFANGSMAGEGNDDVGRFLIKGRYEVATRECHWIKSYVGAHDVFYRGFREGKGIWGTWEIAIPYHGGFHIWPRGAEESESQRETAELVQPVDAIGPSVNAPVEGKTLPHVPQNYGVRRQAKRDTAFDGLRSSEIAVKAAARFACRRTP